MIILISDLLITVLNNKLDDFSQNCLKKKTGQLITKIYIYIFLNSGKDASLQRAILFERIFNYTQLQSLYSTRQEKVLLLNSPQVVSAS